ncbi:MAG: hypothetical protein H0Z31_05995 [Bacillus sp. (in: Bacteria)]|nr:hypothetical protein [Bacillus sp. (in: firmicutes)]
MLIFSKLKLFTRRRTPAGTRSQARPLFERCEGSILHLARGKRPPQA